MYRKIQSIWVICYSLFLLAGNTHNLQLATRNVYKTEVHVYLRLLIDELKQLWSFRALTYNVS
jgi:hypothetical protein